MSPFLFPFDCAGLFGRLAAAGPRPGLQVTEGVIYATITMGMACFPNLKCLFLKKKKPNLCFSKDDEVSPPGIAHYVHGGSPPLPSLSSCWIHTRQHFCVRFPVLKMTMKRTSLAFIPLVLATDVELIGGNAGCIDKSPFSEC